MIDLITNYKSQITKWVKENRLEAFWLAVILLIGAFFRLYRIDEYMTFLGDEGRDAIIVRRLLVNFDPILIGPGTSVGNMYLGPIYYYMIAPFLLLFNFSPVGPSVFIALLGIITIYSMWKVWNEKKWKWLVVTGISLSIVLQSHYLGLLLIPVLFIYWILSI